HAPGRLAWDDGLAAVAHAVAEPEGVRVPVLRCEAVDRGQCRGDAARVPVEGAGEEYVAADAGVESLHQAALATDSGDGEAVGDGLTHGRDIRRDPANRLITANVMAEARDDLVE